MFLFIIGLDILKLDVHVLIHRDQGASDGKIVLEFDGDLLIDQAFKERKENLDREMRRGDWQGVNSFRGEGGKGKGKRSKPSHTTTNEKGKRKRKREKSLIG